MDYKSALIQYKKYHTYYDSISSETTNERILDLETKYETAQKEKENQQLLAEAEITKKEITNTRILLITCFLIIVLAIILIINYYKMLQLRNKVNSRLESEVATRTAELKERNDRLEEEYAFINSHNLRAPVARVKGVFNALQSNDGKDIDGINSLEVFEQSINELDLVINQMNESLRN